MLWITWSNISKFTKGGLHCMNIWFSQYYIRLAKTPLCSRTFGTTTLLSLPFPHPQLLCARCYCRRVAWCSQNSPLFSHPLQPLCWLPSPFTLLLHIGTWLSCLHSLVFQVSIARFFSFCMLKYFLNSVLK